MPSSKLLSSLKHVSDRVKRAHNEPPVPHYHQYITGLRGVIVIQSLVWTYLQTFAPAMVYPSSVVQTNGPTWQYILRDLFCAPLWNPSLIYSWFLILSARSSSIPFLSNPCPVSYAGSLIRRNIRVGFSISVATALAIAIFSKTENGYFDTFNSILPGSAVKAPVQPPSPLSGFLSIYDLLWVNRGWYDQAANQFWPTNTMWLPSLVYYQSYTVYIMMVILPFTRPVWHFQGLVAFALASYWLETWAWYSATGLFIADLAINSTLREEFKKGIKIVDGFRIPYVIPAVASIILGLFQKYLWIAAFPDRINGELVLHPVFNTGGSAASAVDNLNPTEPYPRLDDWMVVVGVMLLVELFGPVQNALSTPVLTYLGDRSLSIFVAQSLFCYSAGIKIFLRLTTAHGLSIAGAGAVVLFTCIPATVALAEIFHRTIDVPSRWLARHFFIWAKE